MLFHQLTGWILMWYLTGCRLVGKECVDEYM